MKTIAILAFIGSMTFQTTVQAGQDNFETLKSLAGTWETKDENGQPTLITYELIAHDTAILEKALGMVSVYAQDGNSILMTHYCMAGNQPRLRADLSKSNIIEFKLVDVQNLQPGAGHISGARFELIDQDHMVQKWTWLENGVESFFDFTLTRKH